MSDAPVAPSPPDSYDSRSPSPCSPPSPPSHGNRPSTSSLTIFTDSSFGNGSIVAGTRFFPNNNDEPKDKGLGRWVREWRPVVADVVPTRRSLASFKRAPRYGFQDRLDDVQTEKLRIRWVALESMALSFFAQTGECFKIPKEFPQTLLAELPSSVARKRKGPGVLASLGKLSVLPLEIRSEVCSYFDVQAAFNFSHVSPRAREILVFTQRWSGLFPRLFCVFLHSCGFMRASHHPFGDFSGFYIPFALAQQVPLLADVFDPRQRELYIQRIESSRPASRLLSHR